MLEFLNKMKTISSIPHNIVFLQTEYVILKLLQKKMEIDMKNVYVAFAKRFASTSWSVKLVKEFFVINALIK